VHAQEDTPFVYRVKTIDGIEGIEITDVKNVTIKSYVIPKTIDDLPVLAVELENMHLEKVDVSQATELIKLNLNYNRVKSIDLSNNAKLKEFRLAGNFINSIDLSGAENLELLFLYYNQLESLDVSHLTKLKTLNVRENNLTTLDLTNLVNLENLTVYENHLKSLDVAKLTELSSLDVSENYLTEINVENLTKLTYLDVEKNKINSLNVDNLVNLRSLNIGNNMITTINISHIPNLTSFYYFLNPLNPDLKKEFLTNPSWRSDYIKPKIYFTNTARTNATVEITDDDAEVIKIEYAWVEAGDEPTQWITLFDATQTGELWSEPRTSGYGSWKNGKSINLVIPDEFANASYNLHVRAFDVRGYSEQKESYGYQSDYNDIAKIEKKKLDNRMTIHDQNYKLQMDTMDFEFKKSVLDEELDKYPIKVEKRIGYLDEYNMIVDQIIFQSNETVPANIIFNEPISVTIKDINSPIAFKVINGQYLFIPQWKEGNNLTVKINQSSDLVFSWGNDIYFTDVPYEHYSKKHVDSLVKYNLVKGISSSEYGGNKKITRAEFAVLLSRALGLDNTEVTTTHFTDLKLNNWYGKDVQALFEAGFINGTSNTTFSPMEEITRQDAAVLMHRLLVEFDKVKETTSIEIKDFDKISNYAKEAAQTVTNMGIINGYGQEGVFEPKEKLTRYQMAKILDLTLQQMQFKNE